MLFPLSILIALGMDKLIKINKNYKFYFSVLFLIFLFETGTADKVRTNIENENNRLKTLEEKIKIIPKGKIVVVNNEIIQGRFDILYLTAKYSLRSMNGNSSFIPGNIIPINSCKKVNSGLLYAFETMKQNKINFKKPSQEEFIFIDFPNNCKLEINNL